MTPLRAAIFDVGDVLVRYDLSAHRPWEERLGLPPGGLAAAFGRMWEAEQLALGGDEELHWRALAAGLGVPPEELPALQEGFFACERPVAPMLDFVSRLRPRYRVGILTNAGRSARRALEARLRLHELADDVVVSGELGFAKPDRRIFEHALARLGVEAREAVFADDKRANVDAARALGMTGVVVRDPEEALATLAALLPL